MTYADTGKPVPHARVSVTGFDQYQTACGPARSSPRPMPRGGSARMPGRAPAASCPRILPTGSPTWPHHKSIDWPKGAITHSVDLALPRGVMMRGKVTEQGSGRPISAAMVAYYSPPDRE